MDDRNDLAFSFRSIQSFQCPLPQSWRYGLVAMTLCCVFGDANGVHAQLQKEPTPAPPGIEQITEGRVTATISFLASDELAGRGTGSAEFNIAAAYVAARFRGAGLEGLGIDGSYYHETLNEQTKTPTELVFQNAGQAPIANAGLLIAGVHAFEFTGPVSDLSLDAFKDQEIQPGTLQGVVRGSFSTAAKGSRALSQLLRLATQLKAAGAQALILDADSDSEWIKLADAARTKARVEAPGRTAVSRPDLPIVLVSPATRWEGDVHLSIPPQLVETKAMRNVIGVLRGSDPELTHQAIVYSAHLDHLGTNPKMPEDGIFNGADDDASGVTAVVTLADAFGAMPVRPKRSLLFMAFWGEESGLLGSKQFVATPSWPLDRIIANINIEMIGRPEGGARGKIWVTGWQESNLGSLMNASASRYGFEIFEHPKFSSMLYRSSDNWSFVEKGVIAHSFSAGSLHPDYHQPDDEWDRLEIPHMVQVIRSLMLGSLPLIDGSETPKTTAK